MCCMLFPHDCPLATSACVLETVHSTVRGLRSTILGFLQCHYYYHYQHQLMSFLLHHCNAWHSFHARVGRFSPFLYLRSVAIAVMLFWLRLVVLVSPCFLGSRIPRDYRFPPAPLFLCSERKPSSLTTGSSKL